MAILNSLFAAIPNLINIATSAIEVQKPGGIPWEVLIVSVFDFVVVYGWRIILFTLLLKLLLSPLDFLSRYRMKKNSKIMESVKDQFEALDKQFTDPLEKMRARTALQKKHGMNNGVLACLPMLVAPIIFIWMSFSMSAIAQYMNVRNYLEWYNVYQSAYSIAISGSVDESGNEIISPVPESQAIEIAQSAVLDYYKEHGSNDSFLWVKSIWSSDVPWQKPIKNETDFRNAIGNRYHRDNASWFIKITPKLDEDQNIVGENRESLSTTERDEVLNLYNQVTEKLQNSPENRVNGYLIFVVIAGVVSYFSFGIMQKQQRSSGMNMMGNPFGDTSDKINKVMMRWIMPGMYLVFGLIQTSMFTIYMIASSLISLGLTSLTMFILKMLDKKKEHDEVTIIKRYGRPDPKELIDKEFKKKDNNE